MPITPFQFLEMERRAAQGKKKAAAVPSGQPVERESDLHEDIATYCREHGFYYVHSRMDKRTTTELGVTDFIIALPGGRTAWIEAKARKNKPSSEQLGVGVFLRKLGHVHATVWNMEQFINALTEGATT